MQDGNGKVTETVRFDVRKRLLLAAIGGCFLVIPFSLFALVLWLFPYSGGLWTFSAWLSLFLLCGWLAFPEAVVSRSWRVGVACTFAYALVFFVGTFIADVDWNLIRSRLGSSGNLMLGLALVVLIAAFYTGVCSRTLSGILASVLVGPVAATTSCSSIRLLTSVHEKEIFWLPNSLQFFLYIAIAVASVSLIVYPGVWLGIWIGGRRKAAK